MLEKEPDPMSRPEVHLVTSPAAWEILVSPVRTEIAEALRLLGPCSVAEVAQVIDRPADTLYRHIELLQQAGFVRQAGFRKGDRNVEQLIDVVADDFVVEFSDNKGADENRAIVQTVKSFANAAQRAVRDSASAHQLEFGASARNISINYELSWLTPEQYQEVRELIRQLKKLMDDGKKRREGRLYMTLAVATPVTRKRGAKQNESDEARPTARRSAESAQRRRTRGASEQPAKGKRTPK
jgi:predicted transcriptional regulator